MTLQQIFREKGERERKKEKERERERHTHTYIIITKISKLNIAQTTDIHMYMLF